MEFARSPKDVIEPAQLRPVLVGRFAVHLVGLTVAIAMVVVSDLTAWMPVVGAAVAASAYLQLGGAAIYGAWVVDMLYATAVTYATESPIGLLIVVGWSAALGLIGTSKSWYLPVGVAAAAAAAAIAWEWGRGQTAFEAAIHVVTIAAVAVLTSLVFRTVGLRLRDNEMELRKFFERVPIALVRTSPQGELLELNEAASEMFHEPVIGENVSARYVDPAERESFIAKLMEHGSVQDHEVVFQTGPNSTINAVIAANAIRNDDGSLRYIESAIYDFTSLRETERERETLGRVIDSATDLVALGNWDGSIRYANAASRKWMQEYVTDDEYVHFAQSLSREDFVEVRGAIQEFGSWSGVVTVPGRAGLRVVNTAVQALLSDGDYTVASISRDVTDEVETARQLQELVKAKDELVASISHEIRTPLSVVLGLASELRDSMAEFSPAEQREFATAIADQGQEMAHIVEDLLVAARTDQGSIVLLNERVDLAEQTQATLRLLPEQVVFESVENWVEGSCWADPGRVRQILRNLVINAHRYGGDRIVLTTKTHGDMVSLRVSDDGPGVPGPEIDSIFEPFRRAHSAGSQPASIGLGLTVSRKLARRMGGDLEYSREDGMTAFTVTLPSYQGQN